MELTKSHRNQDTKRWWEIHDKDEYVCPDCGRDNSHKHFNEWEVHHIDREPHKIVGLCRTCHKVRHGATRSEIDLEAWKEGFMSLGSA